MSNITNEMLYDLIKDLKSDMNRQFDEVDRRFVEIDQRMYRIEQRVDRVEQRMERIEIDVREIYNSREKVVVRVTWDFFWNRLTSEEIKKIEEIQQEETVSFESKKA